MKQGVEGNMNPHNQLGMCFNWIFLLEKVNSKKKLLWKQVKTGETTRLHHSEELSFNRVRFFIAIPSSCLV